MEPPLQLPPYFLDISLPFPFIFDLLMVLDSVFLHLSHSNFLWPASFHPTIRNPIQPFTLVVQRSVPTLNSLPELYVANEQFQSNQASEIRSTDIGQAFLKHHVENTLSIILRYNYFLLEQHDMPVSVDSAAVPWDMTSGVIELAEVSPSTWHFTNHRLAPSEFAHVAVDVSLHRNIMQSLLLEPGTLL